MREECLLQSLAAAIEVGAVNLDNFVSTAHTMHNAHCTTRYVQDAGEQLDQLNVCRALHRRRMYLNLYGIRMAANDAATCGAGLEAYPQPPNLRGRPAEHQRMDTARSRRLCTRKDCKKKIAISTTSGDKSRPPKIGRKRRTR